MCGIKLLERLRMLEHVNVGQLPVFLIEVKAVTNDKNIRYFKAYVVRCDRSDAARSFVQQCSNAHGARLVGGKDSLQITKGTAGVQNVLYDQHVSILNADIQVLCNFDLARGLRIGTVARDAQEIDGDVNVEVADEVGHKNPCAFQDADQVQRVAVIIACDFGGQLAHPPVNFVS